MKITKNELSALAASLRKGDYMSPVEVENSTGVARSDKRYPLALLGFKMALMQELENTGRLMTLKGEADGIRVLTDEEATEYNERRFREGVGTMQTANLRIDAVDEANLGEEEQKSHQLRLAVQNAKLDALASAEEKLIGNNIKATLAFKAS